MVKKTFIVQAGKIIQMNSIYTIGNLFQKLCFPTCKIPDKSVWFPNLVKIDDNFAILQQFTTEGHILLNNCSVVVRASQC